MTLLGLDLNASRARAVQGPAGDFALTLPLDPPAQELPLVLSLAAARPEVGLQGVRLLRQMPHLTCQGFLPLVGANGHDYKTEHRGKSEAGTREKTNRHAHAEANASDATHSVKRVWHAGRHKLDAEQALALVWQRLSLVCQHSGGIVVSLPGYMARPQAERVCQLGDQEKVKVLGSLPNLIAAALAAYADRAWQGCALVLDIDDHAISLGLVRALDGHAHLLETRHYPKLGLGVWKDRLINALADCCVLQSRRDPRDLPAADQALFEQLDGLLEAAARGRLMQVGIQGAQWYQNLLITPEQSAAFCGTLLDRLMRQLGIFCQALSDDDAPSQILLTNAAGRLPGLVARLQAFMEAYRQQPRSHGRATRLASGPTAVDGLGQVDAGGLGEEDFGEGLLDRENPGYAPVTVLPPDGPARAAHALGPHFQRGNLAGYHLELIAPLPLPQPFEVGPPRLAFQGQDIFLDEANVMIGTQPSCQLHVDGERHPGVAPRHCEIFIDHHTYVLFNRSRQGTLVNEQAVTGSVVLQAGDWIRLGQGGPQLRFLGSIDRR